MSPLKSKAITMQAVLTPRMKDQELVDRAREGDSEAFAVLVGRYEDRLLHLVRRMVAPADVDDVKQEALLKAFRKLHLFDGRSSFYTWIYRLTANTAMDWRKKERRRRHAPLPEGPDGGDLLEGKAAGPRVRSMQRELGQKIDEAIQALPPKYLEIVLLRERRGLSYEEISRELGISKGTVESRLFRARERLRRQLAHWMKP